MEEHYTTLGLAPGASMQDIKAAFKSRARETHPDKNPGSDDAKHMFSNIAEAYESICRSREHFDAAPHTPPRRASRVRSRSPIAVQHLTEEQKMVYGTYVDDVIRQDIGPTSVHMQGAQRPASIASAPGTMQRSAPTSFLCEKCVLLCSWSRSK